MEQEKELHPLLAKFVLAEIDVSQQRAVARMMGVRGVPVLAALSSDGRERRRSTGFLNKQDLKAYLERLLNPAGVQEADVEKQRLLKILQQDELAEDELAEVIAGMKRTGNRTALRDALLARRPVPSGQLVDLLSHARLDVRLGVMELLEELTGKSHGYNPWTPLNNETAISAWREWAGKATDEQFTRIATFSDEQLQDYLRDLAGNDRERVFRAMRLLEQGDEKTQQAIADYATTHPELSALALNRLREMRYLLLLKSVPRIEAGNAAHRLVYGNLDVRLRILEDLAKRDRRCIPVLRDYLTDSDVMIREAAVDGLAKLDPDRINLFLRHLENEKSVDVQIRILGHLRSGGGKKIAETLIRYTQSEDEDVVIAALEALESQGSSAYQTDQLLGWLRDKRWRVRVAALPLAKTSSDDEVRNELVKLMKDSDDFVRASAARTFEEAVETLDAKDLEKYFVNYPKLRPALVRRYSELEKPVPDQLFELVADQESGDILQFLEAFDYSPDKGLRAARHFIDHKDEDVQGVALGSLARIGSLTDVIPKLQEGDEKKVKAILTHLRTDSQTSLRSAGTGLTEAEVETWIREKLDLSPELDARLPKLIGPNGLSQKRYKELLAAMKEIKSEGQTSDASASRPLPSLKEVLTPYLSHTNQTIRFQAALKSVQIGNENSVDIFLQQLSSLEEDDLEKAMRVLPLVKRTNLFGVVRPFVQSENDTLRYYVLGGLYRHSLAKHFLLPLFAEAEQTNSLLLAKDLAHYEFEQMLKRDYSSRRLTRQWATNLLASASLESTPNPPLISFAMLALRYTWKRGDETSLRRWVHHRNPILRRAAWSGIAICAPRRFAEHAQKVAADPSELVREIVPAAYNGTGSEYWLHYFNEEDTESDYGTFREVYASSTNLFSALQQLTRDPVDRIQIGAYLALMQQGQKLDVAKFVQAIQRLDDASAISDQLASLMTRNFRRLGPEYTALVQFIEPADSDWEQRERTPMLKHFGLLAKTDPSVKSTATAQLKPKTAGEPVDLFTPYRQRQGLPVVLFFYEPTCSDCAALSEELSRQAEIDFPLMDVIKLDINDEAAEKMNAALCELAGQPKLSGKTPALISGAGILAGTDTGLEKLIPFLTDSAAIPAAGWLPSSEALAALDPKDEAGGSELPAGGNSAASVAPLVVHTLVPVSDAPPPPLLSESVATGTSALQQPATESNRSHQDTSPKAVKRFHPALFIPSLLLLVLMVKAPDSRGLYLTVIVFPVAFALGLLPALLLQDAGGLRVLFWLADFILFTVAVGLLVEVWEQQRKKKGAKSLVSPRTFDAPLPRTPRLILAGTAGFALALMVGYLAHLPFSGNPGNAILGSCLALLAALVLGRVSRESDASPMIWKIGIGLVGLLLFASIIAVEFSQ